MVLFGKKIDAMRDTV